MTTQLEKCPAEERYCLGGHSENQDCRYPKHALWCIGKHDKAGYCMDAVVLGDKGLIGGLHIQQKTAMDSAATYIEIEGTVYSTWQIDELLEQLPKILKVMRARIAKEEEQWPNEPGW